MIADRQPEQNGEVMSNQGVNSDGVKNRPDDKNNDRGNDSEKETREDVDIAPEYDLSQGVRGKHAKAMRDGYTMVIRHSDGTTEVRDVTRRLGTVVLDPDLRAYVPNSEAVNRALRSLIGQEPQLPAPGDAGR